MAKACHTAWATMVTTKQQVRNGIIKLARQINEHGQHMQDAILLLQLRWIKKYKRHHFKSICDKLEVESNPRIKCICDKLEVVYKPRSKRKDKRATLICNGLK
jgi:hypothetical protein